MDGIDVNRLRLGKLRAAIGFVPQETFLFSDTLAENIALPEGDAAAAPLPEVEAAAELAKEICLVFDCRGDGRSPLPGCRRGRLPHKEGKTMESTILEALPFKVDLEQLKKSLRVKEGTEMVGKLESMVQEAQKIARPKVCYRTAYVESKGDDHLMIEGIQFTSRVLRVNLDKVYRVFPYVATCGLELEGWSKSVDGILEQFWAEEIKVLAVRGTIRYLHEYLPDRYQPGQISRISPGSLPDWPLSEQKPLFALL